MADGSSSLTALSGTQSALDPAGSAAAGIATLSTVMFVGAAVIFTGVMVLALAAVFAPEGWRRRIARRGLVVGGGIVLPVVTLTALLIYGLGLARRIVAEPAVAPVEIEVVGEQFWWRVRYPDVAPAPDGRGGLAGFETANEVHVPVGRPVRLTLVSPDVIHSFWVPRLAGKLDLVPGAVNRLTLQADRPGVYRGQCAEFCGASHALMSFRVVAHEPAAYAAWLADQRRAADEPRIPFTRRGRDLFLASGCGACHTVRGTPAAGTLGPDLTHLGSRAMIAAESFPRNQGTLAGWIADAGRLKPGNRMPSFPVFTGEELRALAAWLESLE